MTSFKQELDAEVARLRKEAAKPRKLHRYATGYRVSDTIRLYCRPSQPTILRLTISYDIVHQLWLWRDYYGQEHKAPERMPQWVRHNACAEFLSFTEGLPGCLLRLEAPFHYRRHGTLMTQRADAWVFTTTVGARKLGLKPGIESGRIIRTIPWPEQRGFILMFEPHDMAHGATMSKSEFKDYATAFAAGEDPERGTE